MFFKRQPPPPPPPQSKVPGWVQLAVPIVFTAIMGLSAYSFNGYKSHAEMIMAGNKATIEKVDERIKKELDEKVDDRTMQMMILMQEQQQKTTDDKIEAVDSKIEDVDEKLEKVLNLLLQNQK